jgi:hypothetical protein
VEWLAQSRLEKEKAYLWNLFVATDQFEFAVQERVKAVEKEHGKIVDNRAERGRRVGNTTDFLIFRLRKQSCP